jgi:hypothetical protein
MNNPEPTQRRLEELRARLEVVRQEMISLPGFTSCGVGIADEVARRPGLSPETVQPKDLIVNVSFSTAEHLEQSRDAIMSLLGDTPVELRIAVARLL